jgi:hypothetical protein
MRLRTCNSARRSRWKRTASWSRSTTSTASSSSTFCSKVRSGALAGRVGQRAGVADGSDERPDAIVCAAQLEDLFDDGAVLDLELVRLDARWNLVWALLDLGAQAALGVRDGRADDAANQATDVDRDRAARQANALGHLGDRPDLGVLVLVLGHEQHAIVVTDVGGKGDVHVWEDDGVFEWDEQKGAHSGSTSQAGTTL